MSLRASHFLWGIIFGIAALVAFTCGNPAHAQKPLVKKSFTDTIPTYVIRVGVVELQRSIDSLIWASGFFGQSMVVDNANWLKSVQQRQLNNIFRIISIDSTTVPKVKH